jgi:hypothetical protein
MRQGRLDKFPSGNGSNGFREIRRETHSDVLDENLLQRLWRALSGKMKKEQQQQEHNIINESKEGKRVN